MNSKMEMYSLELLYENWLDEGSRADELLELLEQIGIGDDCSLREEEELIWAVDSVQKEVFFSGIRHAEKCGEVGVTPGENWKLAGEKQQEFLTACKKNRMEDFPIDFREKSGKILGEVRQAGIHTGQQILKLLHNNS